MDAVPTGNTIADTRGPLAEAIAVADKAIDILDRLLGDQHLLEVLDHDPAEAAPRATKAVEPRTLGVAIQTRGLAAARTTRR